MKVAIIGSREITKADIESCLPEGAALIISSGERGAGRAAEMYANERGLSKLIIRPEHKKYGNVARYMRDRLIVDNADVLIVFWNGKNPVAKCIINYAKLKEKEVIINLICERLSLVRPS